MGGGKGVGKITPQMVEIRLNYNLRIRLTQFSVLLKKYLTRFKCYVTNCMNHIQKQYTENLSIIKKVTFYLWKDSLENVSGLKLQFIFRLEFVRHSLRFSTLFIYSNLETK